MTLLRTDSSGQTLWIRNYSAKEDATSFSTDRATAMIRTSDGCYAIVGSTQFASETHQDVFFVKTETLEQTPQTTPNPSPATSEPSTTQDPTQTLQPSINPTQSTQAASPSSNNLSNSTSNPNILQISNQETTLLIAGAVLFAVIVSVALIVARTKRKKLHKIP